MIQDYLELLAHELSFDRSLSRRVRQEAEDHLWEAVAADPAGNMLAAQQRAIANFGDARAIAAQFAVISLARHSRRAGFAAVLVIAGVFIAMKARISWYAATQWVISDNLRAVSGLVVQIDRYAFWLSLIVVCGSVRRSSMKSSIWAIEGAQDEVMTLGTGVLPFWNPRPTTLSSSTEVSAPTTVLVFA